MLQYIIILCYANIVRMEINIRSDFISTQIKRNKTKLQNRGNDDDRYRRLLRGAREGEYFNPLYSSAHIYFRGETG